MLNYKIHILHICSLFYISIIFLYYIYIMGTRYKRRYKKRTLKNKRRTYKRGQSKLKLKGGGHDMNVVQGQRMFDYVTDGVKYSATQGQ
jgi:hypothetical protein